jgi:hypothetical protein
MDLWNIREDVQERAALRKFACIGAKRVKLEQRFSGLYRAVRVWTHDSCFTEMLYDSDITKEDYNGDYR